MSTISPLNFLVGVLGGLIFLAIVLAFGFKSDNISIYDRKKFNRNRIILQFIWFSPFLLVFIYLLLTQSFGLDKFLMLVLFPMLFLLGGEYVFLRPQMDAYIRDANKFFNNLKYDAQEARYSFDCTKDKLVLNRDKPEYTSFGLIDIRLDRIYKNDFDEYFWIQGSAKGASETIIKHLDGYVVKNLLRVDRNVYLQEFNEEPYHKNK